MLAGVIGSLDLMRRRIETGDLAALERYRVNAMQAAQRAATLTARSSPSVVASRSISRRSTSTPWCGHRGSPARTLGENVEIDIRIGEEPLFARTDVSQLENSLLNLAINARDAMPDGGRLTIAARRASPAEAAEVARPARSPSSKCRTRAPACRPKRSPRPSPFFTTKPLGQGTGLGLSQIYGFARQSGGHVAIRSREGEGTSIRLLLPAEMGEAAAEPVPHRSEAPAGEGETVLVVEDEAWFAC